MYRDNQPRGVKMATKKKKMSAQTKRTLNAVSITALAMLSLMLILRNCDRCKSKCNDAATKVILLDSANYMLPGTVSIVNNNNPVIGISSDVKVDNKVNNSAKAVNTTHPVKKSKPSVKPCPQTAADAKQNAKPETTNVNFGCGAHDNTVNVNNGTVNNYYGAAAEAATKTARVQRASCVTNQVVRCR